MEEPESIDPTNLADAPVIPTSETTTPAGYSPPVVDEARDWDIGPLDILLGLLTFPLLIWVAQYAFTGSEKLIATRQARLKVYAWLLAAEALIAAAVIWWFAIR